MFWSPSNATLTALGFLETHGIGLWTHSAKPLLLVDANCDTMCVNLYKSEEEMNDSGVGEALMAYRHAAARRWLIQVGVPREVLDLLDTVTTTDGLSFAEVEELRKSRTAQAEAVALTRAENIAAAAAADAAAAAADLSHIAPPGWDMIGGIDPYDGGCAADCR